ncbi:hypothetical protein MZD04_gp167 [Pseudomonas phage Psa21]|uniref:Uncharacterized protein n=1 Tax=Pseudomonas phage Psa21 TaxID=2530023 RepID=A0A481W5P2_9CAUD|nr:hypothetical protein MZD04_gp167 [Pseudomonas phage Psa21]QBJ02694.1 hypothetical protein PSA21_167 [Pseudomonas phage Psa21]
MKQIDYLIEDMVNHVRHRASIGVGTKVVVFTASQNTSAVFKAAGRVAHSILKNSEWDNACIENSEATLRTELLLKELFYNKRIVLDVYEKDAPYSLGNFVTLDVGNFDKVYFDLDTCEKVIHAMTADSE